MLVRTINPLILCLLFLTSGISVAAAQDRCMVTLQSSVSHDTGHHASYREAYIYDSVDQPPYFPGGDGAMVKYINKERRYPRKAYDAKVEGRVVCSFIVDTDGTIENVDIVRSVEPSLDAEAKRVIREMPKWIAGRIGDNTVPVYCILTIPFRR